jgi:diguanylate cyclase (GGDEF)-like protein
MQRNETIVVIDDDDEIRTLVEIALARPGRTIVGFGDGDAALRFLSEAERVDLVVSDVLMEGYDGHRLLRHLRSNARTAPTPVIFVGEIDNPDERIGGMHDRGVEHVLKPFDIDALRQRVDAALLRGPVRAAVRDGVTGLPLREQFQADLDDALRAAAGGSSPLAVCAVAVLDGAPPAVDRDERLVRIAKIVSAQLRATDAAAFMGDGRFAMLHRACDAAGAVLIASRILAAVAADPLCVRAGIAVGIAAASAPVAADAATFLRTADEALRAAKESAGERMAVREL